MNEKRVATRATSLRFALPDYCPRHTLIIAVAPNRYVIIVNIITIRLHFMHKGTCVLAPTMA